LEFRGEQVLVKILGNDSFDDVDLALFAVESEVSGRFAPVTAAAGRVVVDNSARFRMDPDVPLVVPEVDAKEIASYRERDIVANPGCSTIQMTVVLNPIHEAARLSRVVTSSYESASNAGKSGIEELSQQTLAIFNDRELKKDKFLRQVAFNCVPQIDGFSDRGYAQEEQGMIDETRKILDEPELPITATAARVPVFCGHSQSLNVETEHKLTPEDAWELLRQAPGVLLYDDPGKGVYPTAIDTVG
jgi:aspartate-semialdehyde dehydrogenase